MLKKFSNFSENEQISENLNIGNNIPEDKNLPEPLGMVSKNYLSNSLNRQTFTKDDLKDAFSYYAFSSISQQPYSEEELEEQFNVWFDEKYNTKNITESAQLYPDGWKELDGVFMGPDAFKGLDEFNAKHKAENQSEDKIYSIKNELENKYSTNEAIESISIEDDEEGKFIQFNIKCETDIEGTSMEYNGYRLKYNHICEINNNDKDDEIIITENYKKNTFGI
ncbi:hypothetical protein M0Q50_03030 [bacterium]|jgi:hypothetical protein|nr:hypothetical protein [bacterium]